MNDFDMDALPDYIVEGIEKLEQAKQSGELYDCEASDLLSIINTAEVRHYISSGLARELRFKYDL